MFGRCIVLGLSALFVAPASGLKVLGSGPCAFGYGEGCQKDANGVGVDPAPWNEHAVEEASAKKEGIDKATRDKVGSILEGILSKLANHKNKDLVQVKGGLSKVVVHEQEAVMSEQVAGVLQGFLKKQGAVGEALGRLLAAEAPTDYACKYFGACNGASANHPMDAATKDQVAKLLEGILGNLQSHKD